MKQYRVPFFERLSEMLGADGIRLKVAYSEPFCSDAAKRDTAELSSELAVNAPGHWLFGARILYQPLLREIGKADLTVVEHASRYVNNHILLFARLLRAKRFAFWGLGSNKQADRSFVAEWYKSATVRQANWYFAYTRKVAEEVAGYGVPCERITAVENAVDTRELQQQVLSISDGERDSVRVKLGIEAGDPVGVFCGMLDPVKGVPFLIDCAKLIRQSVLNFHLLLVGGGSEKEKVQQLIGDLPWVHMVGPKFGRDKALMFGISNVFLIPGRVGLAILDSFAAKLPLFTVRLPIHGPEIEYLQGGVNGFMLEPNARVYADTVIRVLRDPALLQSLKDGAGRSAQKYSIENMVENFRSGICSCLQHGGSRSKAQSAS